MNPTHTALTTHPAAAAIEGPIGTLGMFRLVDAFGNGIDVIDAAEAAALIDAEKAHADRFAGAGMAQHLVTNEPQG
jgi:hypothetical protein